MPRQETVSAFVPVFVSSAFCGVREAPGFLTEALFLLAIEALLLETLFWNLAEDTLSEETELLSFCLAGNLFCCIFKVSLSDVFIALLYRENPVLKRKELL